MVLDKINCPCGLGLTASGARRHTRARTHTHTHAYTHTHTHKNTYTSVDKPYTLWKPLRLQTLTHTFTHTRAHTHTHTHMCRQAATPQEAPEAPDEESQVVCLTEDKAQELQHVMCLVALCSEGLTLRLPRAPQR